MHFTNFLRLALLAASQIDAAPVTEPEAQILHAIHELGKRADPHPVSCGPVENERAWPLQSVQDAYNALTMNGVLPDPQKPAAGGRVYPRPYGSNGGIPTDPDVVTALNAIPECVTGQPMMKYFEFPLTDPVFAGGDAASQGPDRVIAISPSPGQGGTRTFTYCLAITHRGGTSDTDPSFRPCV